MTSGNKNKASLYLDTNVILDYLRQRGNDSVMLLESIKRRKIITWTSYFTLFEITEKQQEDTWIWKRVKNKESLDDIIRTRYPRKLNRDEKRSVFDELSLKFWDNFIETNIIYINLPKDDDWDEILDLITWYNISLGDAFQVSAAMQTNCDIFVTKDSQLSTEIEAIKEEKKTKLLVSNPANIERVLRENGFKPIFPEEDQE